MESVEVSEEEGQASLSSYGKIQQRNLSSCSNSSLRSLRISRCVFSVFFLENTTIPNLHEVKENMTMGTTLVTNPSGGFLVRGRGRSSSL